MFKKKTKYMMSLRKKIRTQLWESDIDEMLTMLVKGAATMGEQHVRGVVLRELSCRLLPRM